MARSALVKPSAVLAALAASVLPLGAGAQTLPVADAGPDQQLDCAPPAGLEVTLDGSGSSDPDDPDAELTFSWSGEVLGEGEVLEGAMPTFLAPPGAHTLILTVDDGVDGQAVDEVLVEVTADTEPPVLTLTGEDVSLWPPNHKYHPIAAEDFVAEASDACDAELSAEDVIFEEVVSDEEENGRGDGSTTADVLLAYGCGDALIRAERQGPGDGRVYEATLALADAAGNQATDTFLVTVPKSPGQGPAIDSGDLYSVDSSTCAAVELCPSAPDPACTSADGRSQLAMNEGKRARIGWKASDFPAGEGELGEGSEGVDYQVCVYVDDGTVSGAEASPAAPGGDRWRTGSRGQSYRAKGGPSAGLDRVRIRSGADASDVKVAGKGDDVELPELPVTEGAVVVVQLHGSDGSCLETTFDDPHVNRPGRYRARAK